MLQAHIALNETAKAEEDLKKVSKLQSLHDNAHRILGSSKENKAPLQD